jgi:diazepam-binding inhibitor (GABA receptor modulating acyl-CoA-binding protein)
MDSYPLAKHFDEAAKQIKLIKTKPSSDDLLKLYSLYKQANEGDNTTEQPSFYQLEAKAKWNAWNTQKGKSKEQAKHEYVEECLRHLPDDVKKTLSA